MKMGDLVLAKFPNQSGEVGLVLSKKLEPCGPLNQRSRVRVLWSDDDEIHWENVKHLEVVNNESR